MCGTSGVALHIREPGDMQISKSCLLLMALTSSLDFLDACLFVATAQLPSLADLGA